jgi:EPS-associated MarR family transcriptional regulator
MSMLADKVRYELFRLLEPNPELSQREVARALGISLGKVNFCVKALVAKGWLKVANFKHSKHKAGYMYLLTPRGVEEKARLTGQYLQIKLKEYEALNREIEGIREELRRQAGRVPSRSSHEKR